MHGVISQAYRNLASAVLSRTLEDVKMQEDVQSFIRGAWCEVLCDIANIQYDSFLKQFWDNTFANPVPMKIKVGAWGMNDTWWICYDQEDILFMSHTLIGLSKHLHMNKAFVAHMSNSGLPARGMYMAKIDATNPTCWKGLPIRRRYGDFQHFLKRNFIGGQGVVLADGIYYPSENIILSTHGSKLAEGDRREGIK